MEIRRSAGPRGADAGSTKGGYPPTGKARGGPRLFLLGCALGVLFWIVDSLVDSLIFDEGSVADQLFHPGSVEVWLRSFVFAMLAVLGTYAQYVVNRRRRLERALAEKEQMYRTLFENAPVGIGIADMEGNLMAFNEAMLRPGGYRPEDIAQIKNVAGLYYSLGQRDEMLARAREHGFLDKGAVQFKRKDGAPYDALLSLRPVSIQGETCWQATVEDVTERVAAEQALQESEQRFRTVVGNVPIILWALDRDGVFTLSDGKGLDILGMKPGEVVGRSIADVYRDAPEIIENNRRALAGESFNSVVQVGGLSFDCWYQPLRDGNGGVIGAIGVAADVTERRRAQEALRQSEEQFRDLVENINEVIYALDATGCVTYVSPAVEEVGGYKPAEVLGRSFTEFIHPEDLPEILQSFQRVVSGNMEPSEYRVLTKSGDVHWVRSSSRLVYEDGQIAGLRAVLMDITDRKQAEEALRESESRQRALLDAMPDLMCRVRRDGLFLDFRPGGDALPRLGDADLAGRNIAAVLPAGVVEQILHHVERSLSGGDMQVFEYQHRLQGEMRDFEARIVPSGPDEVLALVRDITERKQMEDTIRHLAYHDPLTGLPNRVLFQDRFGQALAQARRSNQPLALMSLDLDRFKVINDTLGHAGGDHLLQAVAARLTRIVRDGDTIARVGGDEFMLSFPGAGRPEDAVKVADKILRSLRRPFSVDGQEFHSTASLGLAFYPHDGRDADTLRKNADAAMYRAKEQGRNNYQLYTAAMNAEASQRLALENSLRRALERDEFAVYYQPQADVQTGGIVGIEALVRWQHPERGLVLPGEFIPIAEETGLIVPLGERVLRTACRQAKSWQDGGLSPLRIAVNLSTRQFRQPSLVDAVTGILEETGLSPHLLELEITEGVAMQDVDFVIVVLRSLHEMGVRISIDDFGSGYSSLSYLKNFPIQTLKIDRSFVDDLTVDASDAAITSAVIAMAHSLNLNVIAEGVETEAQLAFLRERGCDQFQGFLLAGPMSGDSVRAWLGRKDRTRVAAKQAAP